MNIVQVSEHSNCYSHTPPMICMITRMNIHLIRSFPRQKYEHVPCSTTIRFSISSGTVTTDRLIHRCCFSTKVHSFEEYLLGSFAKMVQFEMNRHVFPSLSLYPPSESTSEFRKFEYAIFWRFRSTFQSSCNSSELDIRLEIRNYRSRASHFRYISIASNGKYVICSTADTHLSNE